jgi:hypothetical protein
MPSKTGHHRKTATAPGSQAARAISSVSQASAMPGATGYILTSVLWQGESHAF